MHFVWDWNGTLFNDLELVVASVNHGLSRLGARPIDLDGYRTHYTRPVKRFYDRLMGHEVSHHDWLILDRAFHEAYRQALAGARLTADAAEALQTVAHGGHTQSLLSMFPHADLVPLVERLGIAGYFDRIDGLAEEGRPGDLKAVYLERHLRQMIGAEDPADVMVIGDTPDDAMAAFHVGARAILYDGGSHHRHDLESTGLEVAPSLMAAVRSALGYRPATP